ncbi:MAG: adenylate kinase [Erysipelotrichaceae bacterium]
MRLIITGAAGAGKGTIAKKIKEYYNIAHISSGDMFRSEISSGSALGNLANDYIKAGKLVPDDVTIEMVLKRISAADCQNGYLLDGFPRTLAQAEALESELFKRNESTEMVINLTVTFDTLIKRIVGRRICSNCGEIYNLYYKAPSVEGVCDICQSTLTQRSDDTEEKLAIRWQEFNESTLAVLSYYGDKGLLLDINADKGSNEVWQEVVKQLGDLK